MKYAGLMLFDSANGPGWRVSLFVSGCGFHCNGCFNEVAQDFNYGQIFTTETRQQIEAALADERISGLSLLGGDPLCQNIEDLSELIELAYIAHQYHKTVWLWSGYTWEHLFGKEDTPVILHRMRKALVRQVDVLVDGQYIEEYRDTSLAFRGSSNQRIIDVQKSLAAGEVVLWGEIPDQISIEEYMKETHNENN